MGPLHKHSNDIYLMFDSTQKVMIPPDTSDLRQQKACLVDLNSSVDLTCKNDKILI